MKVLLAHNHGSAGLKVKTSRLLWRIVPFRLTVKRVSTDLSLFDASVTCTQLERNNNFKHSKGTQTMTTPTYNRLNKDDAIVLLVDHQTGLISLVQDFSPNEFKNNVLALADLAKFFELPTILTTSFEQGPNGPLVPELKEMFPDAPYIARPGQINAWDNEDFVKAIKATGRKQIIIAGVVTDVCVAFPTLSALAEGFDVFVVTDASGTFNTTVQQAAWSRMTQAGAQMMNWFSVACELHRDWRNDIEGLGNLLSQRIPNYRNLMNSYSALTAQQK
jgi:nicotinamidase-related amidase